MFRPCRSLNCVSRAIAGLVIAAWLLVPVSADAQVIIRRSFVGTAQSALIEAQADFMIANGIFLEKAAVARKINAQAVEHEMKNSVLWIHTYFERRRLNRMYREEEHPGYQELERRRTALARKIIGVSPEQILQGDVTDNLNWMLQDMLANVSFDAFLPDSDLMTSADNLALTPQEIHHLRLAETKDRQGRSIPFRADQAEVLEVKWPVLLRDPLYTSERKEFESARDDAIKTLSAGQELSSSQEKRLMDSVDALTTALNEKFDTKDQSAQRMLMHLTAKRYIQTLALATYRLVEIGKDAVASDARKFNGKSVVELLNHMMSQGLEFAPPEAGDEAIYRKLFSVIRSIYIQANPGAAAAAEAEKIEAAKKEAEAKREKALRGTQ